MPLAVNVLLEIVTCRQCRTKAEQCLREPEVILVRADFVHVSFLSPMKCAESRRITEVLDLANLRPF